MSRALPRSARNPLRHVKPLACIATLLGSFMLASSAYSQDVAWVRQFGSGRPAYDSAQAIDADGYVYIAGGTSGSLDGEPHAGANDAYVRKYDSNGTVLWTREFGTTTYDYATGVAVDETGVYVLGQTGGTLPGQTMTGFVDSFVRKFGLGGAELWTHQFGSPGFNLATGIAADATGIYAVGLTSPPPPQSPPYLPSDDDAIVRKFDRDGVLLWTDQFGTPSLDAAWAVTTDGGNIYVAGTTDGQLGDTSFGLSDGFVRSYDADGLVSWTKQVGTSGFDFLGGIDASADGIFVAGDVVPAPPAPYSREAWLRRLNLVDGGETWQSTVGGAWSISGYDVAVGSSHAFLIGVVDGALPGQSPAGGADAFIQAYDLDGTLIWTDQFGTSSSDLTRAVAVHGSNPYVVGITYGTLPGQTGSGFSDGFLRAFEEDGSGGWTEAWTHQFGAIGPWPYGDAARAIDADGNVFVAGYVGGALPSSSSGGGTDGFVRKYDPEGAVLWTEQFGASYGEYARAIVVGSEGIYVSGEALGQVYVRKFDTEGDLLWHTNFGAAAGVADMALDTEGVYVAGHTWGIMPGQTSAGGADAFLAMLGHDGSLAWTHQFGSSAFDFGKGATVDNTGVYVAGYTRGTLPGQVSAGGQDGFVRKLDVDGDELWTRQFGTSGLEILNAAAPAHEGGLYVGGSSSGELAPHSGGGSDSFVRRYDSTGFVVWTRQFGVSNTDAVQTLDTIGTSLYVAGDVSGAFPGQVFEGGWYDTYIRKLRDDGSEVWTQQLGTSGHEFTYGVAATPLHVYVAGMTDGTFPGETSWGDYDAFVGKLTANSAPVVETLTAPSAPVAIDDQPVSAVATFSDSDGAGESHSCVLDYGDGSVPTAGLVTALTCEGPDHTFAEPGVYAVSVTVTDQDGAIGTSVATQPIVIYDPVGGFVTGGGWINSPEGACPVFCEDATGKAHFGFISKYRHGAHVPTGQTQFQFQAGGLTLHSTVYDWLVIAGAKAKYKGEGSVNGVGGYSFQLNAIDGQAPGGGGEDTFRIRIKEPAGDVIYDNQMGAGPDEDPTTKLGGGSITVHKP